MKDEREFWWFNLRTKQVEFGRKSNSLDRVGPFETEVEAAKAPEVIDARRLAWEDSERED